MSTANHDLMGNDLTELITPVEAYRFDEHGRITGAVSQAAPFTAMEREGGGRIRLGAGGYNVFEDHSPNWHDLDTDQLRPRPALGCAFDPAAVAVREEASLGDVPACRVAYAGPLTGGFDHPGGELRIGFTVPGTYRVQLEPFPLLPLALELLVRA